jgi:hypothetical protein
MEALAAGTKKIENRVGGGERDYAMESLSHEGEARAYWEASP